MKIISNFLKVTFFVSVFFGGIKILGWVTDFENFFLGTVQSEALRQWLDLGFGILTISLIFTALWYFADRNEKSKEKEAMDNVLIKNKEKKLSFSENKRINLLEVRLVRLEAIYDTAKWIVTVFVAGLFFMVIQLIKSK